jgi:hypothetical protein
MLVGRRDERAVVSRAGGLPVPQRQALEVALGIGPGPSPEVFLVGMGVLSLLADTARDGPLACVIDDAQWLDRASAQVLAFVARRLGAEPVAMLFITREGNADLRGLPELAVGGLSHDEACALLGAALTEPLDERVRDRIVTEARGNPLALLQLPRALTPAELAGGFGAAGRPPLPGRMQENFRWPATRPS